MKIKYLLTSFPLFFYLTLGAQERQAIEYAAKYDFIPVVDTLEGTLGRPYDFLLLHADGESRFHEANRQFNDSMMFSYSLAYPQYASPKTQAEAQEAVDHFTANMETWKKKTAINYVVRKDLANGIFQNILPHAWPPQHMEGTLKFQWDLGTVQDTLLGLNCYTAQTVYGGRVYTAWFAPSIPIPDGPYVFGGLPGLIVQIRDERGWFTFRLKEVSASPQERFWKANYINPQSKPISRESYVRQSIKQKENPRIPSVLDMPEEQLLDLKERYRSSYFLLLESH
jgi:GLPGLI family protein